MSLVIRKAFFSALAALGMFAPMALAGADPALLALVPPDAKMLVGIQVNQTESSPIGQYLLAQVQLDRNTNQIMTAAGFDPRRDLREILAASGDGMSGLMLGRGSFQPAKISKAAVMAGAVSSKYRGTEILTLAGRGKDKAGSGVAGSIAFLDASTLAAGATDAVKAVLDRRAAGAAFSGQLYDRARQISVANDAWLATLTPPPALSGASQNSPLGPFQNVLQAALQVSAGIKFAATEVTVSAEVVTRSAQDAQSMADLLRFAAGLLQQANRSGSNAPKGPSLADAAQISSTGAAMHVVISLPEQQLEQIFPDSKASAPKKVAMRQ